MSNRETAPEIVRNDHTYKLLNGETQSSIALLNFLFPVELTDEDKRDVRILREEGYAV